MKRRFKQAFGGGKSAALSFALIFFLSTLLLPPVVNAQDKWSAAFRTGINFPTKNLGTTELKTGFGFDGLIGYRVMPHLFVNAGWAWNRFAAKDVQAENDYVETGYMAGLQFVHPLGATKLSYVIGAGALYNHIEVENGDGDLLYNTGHGWGWQADAGLAIPLGKRTHLIPSVRYRSLTRDLKEGSTTTAVDLQYLSVALALPGAFNCN